MSELAQWDSFYVIIGSASGALIGLEFVVLTLVAERPALRTAMAGAAFATPTIVLFGVALLLSALSRFPWQTITIFAVCWGLIGFSGIVYMMIVAWRLRTQAVYQMEFEDWLFQVLLPLTGYSMLVLSALAAPSYTRESLFGVGCAVLLLLFIGIHNAWDAIAYHVFISKRDTDASNVERRGPKNENS